MTEPEAGSENFRLLTEINRMIHEPARFLILAYLYVVESADFLFLERQTGLTAGNLSSHLSKLEDVSYITVKKEFVDKIPRTLLSLTNKGRKAFRLYRQNIKQVLDKLPE